MDLKNTAQSVWCIYDPANNPITITHSHTTERPNQNRHKLRVSERKLNTNEWGNGNMFSPSWRVQRKGKEHSGWDPHLFFLSVHEKSCQGEFIFMVTDFHEWEIWCSIFTAKTKVTKMSLIFPPFSSRDMKLSLIFFLPGISHCLGQPSTTHELVMGRDWLT